MKLIVVKNPNVARRFAEALNIRKREADYFKGEEFYITWVLVSGRDRASAFVPSCFHNIENHEQSLRNLVKNCNGIITFSSSMEELKLFKEFYEQLNSNLPIQRMHTNSLTRRFIRKGLETLTEITDLQNLVSNQNTKEKSWSKKSENDKVNHAKLKYQIQLSFTKDFLNLNAYSDQIFQDEQSAEEALSTILRKGNLVVNEVKYEKDIQSPPLLYNLTTLQKDCKKSLGFTKDETIEISESLYEKGFITNPNTEIQTIQKENWKDVNEIVRALATKLSLNLDLNQLKLGKFGKRIIRDNSSNKNEGIYPTRIIPTALNLKENNVYDQIALRFLESLSPSCEMKTLEVNFSAVNFSFRLHASQLVESGWRNIKSSFYREGSEIFSHLPEFEQNEILKILRSKIYGDQKLC